MSLLDHTRVGQPDHPERQAPRSGYPCLSSKSDRGVWDFYKKHAVGGTKSVTAKGIVKAKLNKNVVPYRTLTTSEFDEGQQSFVRNLFDF